MKSDNICGDVLHKDVVIIGNGPSGIALSYMLSGNIPYVVSNNHPDEFLSTRLRPVLNKTLLKEDLINLAGDLEGRSTNPVSLLLDALSHPFADIGLEIAPLIEWRSDGRKIDHIVLGKGPPGGSWHTMDPHILTLSLGSWMALPGLPYKGRDGMEKRASAKNVALYYEEYVKALNLTDNFKCGIIVTKVCKLNENEIKNKNQDVVMTEEDAIYIEDIMLLNERKETEIKRQRHCPISSAINFILSRAQQRYRSDRCCKRPRENQLKHDLSPNRKMREIADHGEIIKLHDFTTHRSQRKLNNFNRCRNKERSISLCSESSISDCINSNECDNLNQYSKSYSNKTNCLNFIRKTINSDTFVEKVPESKFKNNTPNWYVEAYDVKTKRKIIFTCNNLVLANGSSDLPNKLEISYMNKDPDWLLHDVRSLEIELDLYMQQNPIYPNPVIIVGAGLSAADAVIAARARNVPVIHVFRSRTADLSKQLPENMYPEYHKVHQMMQDGGSAYPLYHALPEYSIVSFNDQTRTATLQSKTGDYIKYSVSFVAVLIGSRPDLSFLPHDINSNISKNALIDCKNNTVPIDKRTNLINGYNNLYAIGPLAGDKFVRFLPGGALAVVSDLYNKYRY